MTNTLKVGDRVRRVNNPVPECPLGYETVISEVTHDYLVRYTTTNGIGRVTHYGNFERIDMTHNFKIGDKVRRIREGTEHCPLGFETVVTDVRDNTIYYRSKDGENRWTFPSNFELIAPAAMQATPSTGVTKTVTKTEIRYGNHPFSAYDYLTVSRSMATNRVAIGFNSQNVAVSAEQLRKLAQMFNELAEALEQK